MIQQLTAVSACLIALALSASAENLQLLIDAVPRTGGTITLEARQYFQSEPLTLRGRTGVRLIGQGRGTEIAFVVRAGQELLIDMVGASYCEISQLRVTTRRHRPRVGLLLARTTAGKACAFNRFTSLWWDASASLANVVSLGAEVTLWGHCRFSNTAPGGANLVTGRENWIGAASPFGEFRGGSNLCQRFIGCKFATYARTGRETNIILQSGTGHVEFRGGTISNTTRNCGQRPPDVGAGFRIGGPVDLYPVHQILISNVEAETYGCRVALRVVGNTRGLRVENCLLQSLEESIRIDAILADSLISQNTLDAGKATYGWGVGDRRALVVVDSLARVSNCIFDLRWRWLGKLRFDQSSGDVGHKPEMSLAVFGGEFTENEVIVRAAKHLWISPDATASCNYVQAFLGRP